MKSHAKSRAGQYRKMALALSLVLGVSPLQADTSIEPAQDSPVAALLRRAAETNLEQLPADLAKFKAHYLELLEMHRSSAHSKATHPVTNCNNSGAGSLRAAVAAAGDEDIVDLSGLSCTTITLTESIVTDVDNLTLKDSGGVREISGGNSIRPITHNGRGTLKLDGVSVIEGRYSAGCYGDCVNSDERERIKGGYSGGAENARGGCVNSDERGRMKGGYSGGAGDARGGCIFSRGSVILERGQVRECEVINFDHHGDAEGGGIFAADGVLLIDGAVVRQSRAVSERGNARGGGVFTESRFSMLRAAVENNEARGRFATGGGADADEMTVKYSTVRNNKAVVVNGFGDHCWRYSYASGGGINASLSSGENFIWGATVSGNSAKIESTDVDGVSVRGSGVFIHSKDVLIRLSTIAGNISEGRSDAGGALAVLASGEFVINASTISGNKAYSQLQPNERGWGAGIAMKNDQGVTMQSSIVAGNHVVSSSGQNLASDIGVFEPGLSISSEITGERNFVNFHHAGISWASTNNDILPTTLVNLEPLRDNGGHTLTMMPRAGSPVINNGLPLNNTYDQRGECFARTFGPQTDIGAVERGSICDGIFHDHFENE